MKEKVKGFIIGAGLILTALIMAGCVIFPSVTTVSASSKADKIDNPTVKITQTFKWDRK